MLTAKQNKNVNVSACSSYCNDSPECKFFSLRDPEQVCNLYSSCNLPSESNPSYIISTYEKGTEYFNKLVRIRYSIISWFKILKYNLFERFLFIL